MKNGVDDNEEKKKKQKINKEKTKMGLTSYKNFIRFLMSLSILVR